MIIFLTEYYSVDHVMENERGGEGHVARMGDKTGE
jgi:hypothetical protein